MRYEQPKHRSDSISLERDGERDGERDREMERERQREER